MISSFSTGRGCREQPRLKGASMEAIDIAKLVAIVDQFLTDSKSYLLIAKVFTITHGLLVMAR